MAMDMDTAMAMEKVAKNVNNERNIRNQKRGVIDMYSSGTLSDIPTREVHIYDVSDVNVLWINLQVMADEY